MIIHNCCRIFRITPLRIRECEYLEYIRRKNIVLYGEVMAILTGAQQERLMENDQNTFTKEDTVQVLHQETFVLRRF